MINKIALKSISAQILGFTLLLIGSTRLSIAYNSEIYKIIQDGNLELINGEMLKSIMFSEIYVKLSVFILGIICLGYFNWRNKISIFNILIVSVGLWLLNFLEFFSSELLTGSLNTFFGLITDDMFYSFFISGFLIFISGMLILYMSITPRNEKEQGS
ncbi:hypothetical protein [Winogradskyella helgolandensis]|uniref:hypothetical protein n=1 Tax=Winogradskyella helgolandensis TaxID=2697010 RepID=UPI0015CB0DBC|nr:hypothetical protein [Winogradskyella helgolandensis]